MASKERKATNYIVLDIVRFFAAGAVVFYHLGYLHWSPNWSGSVPNNPFWGDLAPFAEIFRWGWVGVPVFFVLSGFVVAFSASGRSVRHFVENRALRLYPGAVICSSITAAIMYNYGTLQLLPFFNSLILWPAGPWISGVYWTLGIEMVFYAVMALCIWRKVRIQTLGIGLAIASAIFWGVKLFDFIAGSPLKNVLAIFNGQWGSLTLLPNGCYFAIGILMWARTQGFPIQKYLIYMSISVATAVLSLVNTGKFYISEQGGATWQMVEPAAIWLVILIVMIWAIRYNDYASAKLSRIGGAARTIGMMTYPLYLIHDEIGFRIMLASQRMDGRFAFILATIAGIAAAYGVLRIEMPVREYIRSRLHLARARAPEVAQLP